MRIAIVAVVIFVLIGCAERKNIAKETAVVTMKGKPVTLLGKVPQVGQKAPNFTAYNAEFQKVSLSDFKRKTILISVVPSLDTKVCSLQTLRFNEWLKAEPRAFIFITISMDLPFAQKRFCEQEKIDKAIVLSDFDKKEFGNNYGVIIKENGLLARSVFIIDEKGKIKYIQIVPEISNEPDYDAVMKGFGGLTVW